MRTFEELEAAYGRLPAPGARGAVRLIVVRRREGVHETPLLARLDVDQGLEGDRWLRSFRRDARAQVTLMRHDVARLVGDETLAGDNFLVELDLSQAALPAGSRVRLGEALLEVTAKPHTGCKKFAARYGDEALRWINTLPERRLRGVNCRVLEGGAVAVGDEAWVLPREGDVAVP